MRRGIRLRVSGKGFQIGCRGMRDGSEGKGKERRRRGKGREERGFENWVKKRGGKFCRGRGLGLILDLTER